MGSVRRLEFALERAMRSTRLGVFACAALASLGFVSAPSPSPGAEPGRIVFSSDRSGDWRIWTVRPDGSDLKQVTDGRKDEHDVDPAWRPDGREILFSSTRGGTIGVWKTAPDGASLARICDGDQADWSPDGKSIVFRRGGRLYTRELAGAKEMCITPADWPHPSGPSWSPDGKTIAFACRWQGDNAIYLVDAGGGKPRTVYDKKGACEPRWSPDGKRLLYETETHIATIEPDGTGNRLVTWFGGVQRYGQWSPDGTWIVFCQAPSEQGPWELYRIATAGGTPIRITEEGSDMNPDWR